MTVTNTSGESFGRDAPCSPAWARRPSATSTTASASGCWPPSSPRCRSPSGTSSTPTVDQQRTRMYYRLTNDKENKMGGFPLPYGKVRLFIKEPKADAADEVRSQAFLGEDWAKYTPLFAPLDLYVGVAQDVKVERFTMQPEEGPEGRVRRIDLPAVHARRQEGRHQAAVPQRARRGSATACRTSRPRRATRSPCR